MRINTLKLLTTIALTFFGATLFSQENDVLENTPLNSSDSIAKHPLLSDSFSFYAGAYSSFKRIQIAVNGASNNQIINFDESGNFNDNETTLFVNFNWRFSRKWTLTAEYFSLKNITKKTTDTEIEWNNQIYRGITGVTLGFDVNLFRLFFGRTISKGLKHELGIGLGTHILDIKSFIEGDVYINNENTGENASTSLNRSSVSVIAPLPNIGIWYYYAPHPKWLLTTRIDWFAISIKEYSGGLWDVGAGVNYQFHKHIGVGLNYRYFKASAAVNKRSWEGEFSLIYQGPLLSINVNI